MVWSCFKLFEAKRLLFCCYELWTRVEKRKKKKKKVESSSRSLPRNERLHSDAAACCWLLLVMCTSFLSFRRLLFFISFFVSTFARIKAVNKFCFLLITTLDPSCWFFQMNKAHQLIVAEAPSVLQCSAACCTSSGKLPFVSLWKLLTSFYFFFLSTHFTRNLINSLLETTYIPPPPPPTVLVPYLKTSREAITDVSSCVHFKNLFVFNRRKDTRQSTFWHP